MTGREGRATTLQIAVVGSGPAGCYLVERLVREAPGACIDVLDRLPAPFGLVRYGVAADHQGTKAIARVLERALARDGVAFLGGVEVGRDVTLVELAGLYDAVVLAVGAPVDRTLGVPGEGLPGVHGSAAFVGWLNGHPDHAKHAPDLAEVRSVAVIGNGNVALDVARLLAKTPAELAASDLDPETVADLAAMPLAEIHLLGRRSPAEARFDPHELGELAGLARARPAVDPADLPADDGAGPAVAALRKLSGEAGDGRDIPIRFRFHAPVVALHGGSRVAAVEVPGARIPADLVVTCIGYEAAPLGDLRPVGGRFANMDGRIAPGLYAVGWAKRGPSGTIATNRPESHAVAQRIAAEVAPAGRPGRDGLLPLLAARGIRPVDLAGWKRIEAAETAAAEPGRPRRKGRSLAALRAAAFA